MAKIWPAYDGNVPRREGPWAVLPLSEAALLFDLRKKDFVSDSASVPGSGSPTHHYWLPGFRHLLIEVTEAEGRREKWKPGFYLSKVRPDDAFDLLIEHAVTAELGDENVIRVYHQPAIDSQGEDILRITVVLAPDAVKRIGKGTAAFNALFRLKKRLLEMGETRTPIIEYATEAELALDGPS